MGENRFNYFKDTPLAKKPSVLIVIIQRDIEETRKITGYHRNKLEMFPISLSICGSSFKYEDYNTDTLQYILGIK